MASANTFMDSDSQSMQQTPSEAEILQLIQGLAKQYEEVMQLSDFANFIEFPQDSYPRYTWDNPIGLVVTESSDASLVWTSGQDEFNWAS